MIKSIRFLTFALMILMGSVTVAEVYLVTVGTPEAWRNLAGLAIAESIALILAVHRIGFFMERLASAQGESP